MNFIFFLLWLDLFRSLLYYILKFDWVQVLCVKYWIYPRRLGQTCLNVNMKIYYLNLYLTIPAQIILLRYWIQWTCLMSPNISSIWIWCDANDVSYNFIIFKCFLNIGWQYKFDKSIVLQLIKILDGFISRSSYFCDECFSIVIKNYIDGMIGILFVRYVAAGVSFQLLGNFHFEFCRMQ